MQEAVRHLSAGGARAARPSAPPVHIPHAEADALVALLQGARVAPCTWNGAPAFVKRKTRRRGAERLLLALLRPAPRRWLRPGPRPAPLPRQDALSFELDRLLALGAAGAAVPRVLAVSPGAFVLEAVGPSLEQLVQRGDADQAVPLLVPAAEDLAAFHGQGHWHGGAQIRNMTLHRGRITRFDFDREFDRHLPLPVLQALDVLLFVGSIVPAAGPDAARAAARACCARSGAGVHDVLRRVLPWALRLARAGWTRRLAGKEAARLQVAAEALLRVL